MFNKRMIDQKELFPINRNIFKRNMDYKYKNNLNNNYLIIEDNDPRSTRDTPRVESHDNMSITTPKEEINKTVNKTYPQNWEAYNKAQTQEKILFMNLLYDLFSLIPKQKYKGTGRPPADIGEMIFSICLKIYLHFSIRRTGSDVYIAKQLGYINHVPHFNTILKYLKKPVLEHVLKELIVLSALPLKQFEENFTVDSSGFSTSMFARWFNVRTGLTEKRLFKKAHIFSGVKTNVITSIEVTDGYVHDSTMFPMLLNNTAKHFEMKEVSADMGYLSRKNLRLVSECGAVPYIPFRKGATGKARGCAIWKAMYNYFKEHKEEFMKHYHLRSNAESVFSMIKRKQGGRLRTRDNVAQKNEILCKALVHNICVLIQEMFELGIKVNFKEAVPREFMCNIEL